MRFVQFGYSRSYKSSCRGPAWPEGPDIAAQCLHRNSLYVPLSLATRYRSRVYTECFQPDIRNQVLLNGNSTRDHVEAGS